MGVVVVGVGAGAAERFAAVGRFGDSEAINQCTGRFVFNKSKERTLEPTPLSFVQPKIGALKVLCGAVAMASEARWLLNGANCMVIMCPPGECVRFSTVNIKVALAARLTPSV